MTPRIKRMFAALSATLLLSACGKLTSTPISGPVGYGSLSDLSKDEIDNLTRKSFYFGHQSVGRDLMDGVSLIVEESPQLGIRIVEDESVGAMTPGTIAHSRIGQNGAPESKLSKFEDVLDAGAGAKIDSASLKLCYVDITSGSDVQNIFRDYRGRIAALKAKYPNVQFIHFTMPIRSAPIGKKPDLKRFLGIEIQEDQDNIARARFNDLIRAEYEGKEPVFDIAKLESLALESNETHKLKSGNHEYEVMAPSNTYDGGHLSDDAKRHIGEQFIVFLAKS